MSYLAVDTSGKRLTIVANHNNKEYVYTDAECGTNHSVEIMVRIEEVAKNAGLDLKDVDFFACVIGAGSFTGIRIGVSTIKALCFAYNKKALAITSFDTIAYNKQGGKALAVINAGHGGYYVCGYQDKVEVLAPEYVLEERLAELEKEYQLVSFEKLDGFESEIVCTVEGLKSAIKAKQLEVADASLLNPLYVRKSQAEEGRK